MQFGEGELAGTVDSDKQIKLALLGPDFCDVDVKVADRIWLEFLPRRLIA
jgi:hypothetical protein